MDGSRRCYDQVLGARGRAVRARDACAALGAATAALGVAARGGVGAYDAAREDAVARDVRAALDACAEAGVALEVAHEPRAARAALASHAARVAAARGAFEALLDELCHDVAKDARATANAAAGAAEGARDALHDCVAELVDEVPLRRARATASDGYA